jgi:cardiolipin synthase
MSTADSTLWATLYFTAEWVIRLTMLVVVPVRRSPEAAKGWLLLILFLPLVGLAAYIVIGRARPPRWRRERMALLPRALAAVRQRLRGHPNVFQPEMSPELAPAVKLATHLGMLPILGGNAVELMSDYDAIVDRLIADIDGARDHVHLLFYIFADDATGRRVADALKRAAARGVRCRVLLDSLGSRPSLRRLVPDLRAGGVAVHEAAPVRLWRLLLLGRVDLRNHRKIAVIDARVGYAGSLNLVDSTFKAGIVYEELMARVTGPAVLGLQYVFASDWYIETEETLDGPDTFPFPELAGEAPCQVLASGPGFPSSNNQRLAVSLIHGARRRVVMTTPYFVPDEPLLEALKTAAERDVEVHLVVSRKADQVLVSLAQRSYYEELLEAGVTVHLYHEKFLHAKHLSVDDKVMFVGSSNMDQRSFRLNAEVTLLVYDEKAALALRLHQERYFAGSDTLTAEEWEKRPFLSRLAQNLARLLGPLL